MSKEMNEKAPQTLGERLRLIISEKGLTQAAFARSLGVSANYIYLLTSGRKTAISETLAKLIETTYGYPIVWLLTGHAEEEAALALHAEVARRITKLDSRRLKKVAALINELESEKD